MDHADSRLEGGIKSLHNPIRRPHDRAVINQPVYTKSHTVPELYLAHNSPLRKKLVNLEEEFWGRNKLESKPALIKYQRALKTLGLPEMDINSTYFADAEALIGLRNSLIHFKPNWDGLREKEVDLVDRLKGKYKLSKFIESGDFITMESMSASACEWAIRAVFDFIREFHTRTHIDDQKMEGFWLLENKFNLEVVEI